MDKIYDGYCMFCGQQGMVSADENAEDDFTDADEFQNWLNEEATRRCKCDAAQSWWRTEKRVRRAEKRCENIAEEPVSTILRNSVRPIMKFDMDKITIKKDENTYSVYVDSNSRIHVKKEYKVIEDSQE